jgi:hypothetical protein
LRITARPLTMFMKSCCFWKIVCSLLRLSASLSLDMLLWKRTWRNFLLSGNPRNNCSITYFPNNIITIPLQKLNMATTTLVMNLKKYLIPVSATALELRRKSGELTNSENAMVILYQTRSLHK